MVIHLFICTFDDCGVYSRRVEGLKTSRPESIEEVRERIAYFFPGHSEFVVVSDRDDYYRVGRKRMLDREIENHVNMVVATMGGVWDKEANCWKIPKVVKS